jgi:hypothetical protein
VRSVPRLLDEVGEAQPTDVLRVEVDIDVFDTNLHLMQSWIFGEFVPVAEGTRGYCGDRRVYVMGSLEWETSLGTALDVQVRRDTANEDDFAV